MENYQQRVGKVILDDDRTTVYEEGLSAPGENIATKHLINPAIAQKELSENDDLDGLAIRQKTKRLTALRREIMQIKPADGH